MLNAHKNTRSDHFWKLRCQKSARPKQHKMQGIVLDVEFSFYVAGATDSAPCQKWPKREGFVAVSNNGKRGTFEEEL